MLARYTTSEKAGSAPACRSGYGKTFHVTPSGLVAKRRTFVMHVPPRLVLNTAQYSCRDGIHSTSMCHGYWPSLAICTGVGAPHARPSVECRTSTVVVAALHPSVPALTVHISQSPGPRRTTAGETARWFGTESTLTGVSQCVPAADRIT